MGVYDALKLWAHLEEDDDDDDDEEEEEPEEWVGGVTSVLDHSKVM
jgi:hypothetical protein